MSKFQLPAIQSKAHLSTTSIKIYKTHLNKLAAGGFSTIQDLIDKPVQVIARINELMPSNEEKQKKRIYYSAIFYALADTDYVKSSNPYHTAFQGLRDPMP